MRKVVVVALGVAALLVAGCGGGRSSSRTSSFVTTAQSMQAPASSPTPSTSCIASGGYGGLGANENAFDANNDGSTGPAEPSPGAAWYQVLGTERGCVTAYAVQDSASPRIGAREKLDLVSRPYLPNDAKQVVSTNSCAVWKSAALQRATGLLYAKALSTAQRRGMPWGAEVEATYDSAC